MMHKIRLEGDHQTLTFGVVQLVDAMQPGGAKVNINCGFWVNGPLFNLQNFYHFTFFLQKPFIMPECPFVAFLSHSLSIESSLDSPMFRLSLVDPPVAQLTCSTG